MRNLLFRDFVIYFDRHLVFARLKASHRQRFLHRQLVAVRPKSFESSCFSKTTVFVAVIDDLIGNLRLVTLGVLR